MAVKVVKLILELSFTLGLDYPTDTIMSIRILAIVIIILLVLVVNCFQYFGYCFLKIVSGKAYLQAILMKSVKVPSAC